MLIRNRELGSLQKGFTLIEVIVGLAILAGLSLTAMKLLEYVQETRLKISSKREILSLHGQTRLLLENRPACNSSFQGITFKGSSIPQRPSSPVDLDPETNPLHGIKLHYLNNDGSKTHPIFSHDKNDKDLSDIPLNVFGPVEIKATELIMPEHTSGTDLAETTDAEVMPATLVIHSTTRIRRGTDLQNPVLRFRLYLGVTTDSSGLSTIQSCGVNSLNEQRIYYESFLGNNDQVPLLDTNGNRQFYFCGFMGQLHSPNQYKDSLNAHSSETRCKLTPTGTGPLYTWTITTVAIDGQTRCEVVCL